MKKQPQTEADRVAAKAAQANRDFTTINARLGRLISRHERHVADMREWGETHIGADFSHCTDCQNSGPPCYDCCNGSNRL